MGATTVEELEILVSAKIEQVKPQIQKVVQEIKNAVKETEGLGSGMLGKIDTQKIANDAKKVSKQIKEMFDANDTSGMKINGKNIIHGFSSVHGTLKGSTNDLNNVLEAYRNKLKEVERSAETTKQKLSSVGAVKYDTTSIQNFIDNYKKIDSLGGNKGKLNSDIKQSSTHLQDAKQKVRELAGNLRQATAEKLKNGLKSIPSHISKIGQGIKNLSSKFSPVRNSASKFTNHLKIGLGQVVKMAGALFGLRSIYNVLRNAASAWLSSQDAQAKQISANIDYMKYALGSALKPVIETIVNLVYQALKGVQSLIYALTGVNIFANASAKAYSNMANSAKDAQKATQNLADIDEIHNIQEDTSSSSGSGGGTTPNFDLEGVQNADWIQSLIDNVKNGNWYEIGTTIGTKINETLDKIPWEKIKTKASNLGKNVASFLNGGIESTNWQLVGKTLSEGVNTAFSLLNGFAKEFHWDSLGKAVGNGINGALKGLDWNLIKDTCKTVASGIASSLNNFIRTTDWKLVGKTLAEGINTIIDTVLAFVTDFDWKGFGKSVGEGIDSLFKNVDWGKAGKTLGDAVKGILDSITSAIEAIDWQQLAVDVEEFLKNVDWNGISDSLFEGIGAALGGIAAFLGKLIYDGVEGCKQYFQKKIEECGGDVVGGIFKGIVDAIKNVGIWINDHIFKPIINGFKKAFGIHSPSKVMAEMGGYIMEGLKNGIESFIGTIKEVWDKVKTTITDKIEDIKTGAIQIFGRLWLAIVTGAEGAVNFFIKGINKIISGINGLGEYLGFHLDEISEVQWAEDFEKTLNKMAETTEETMEDIEHSVHDGTSEVITDFEKTNREANRSSKSLREIITNNFNNTKNNVIASVNTIKNNTESTFNSLKNSPIFNGIKNTIQNSMNLSGQSRAWGTNTISNYNAGLNSQQNNTTNVMSNVKSILNNFMNIGNTSKNWGINTISNYNNGLNSKQTSTNEIGSRIKNTVRNLLNVPDVSNIWGQNTSIGYSNGLGERQNLIGGTADRIKSTVRNFLSMYNSAEIWGQNTSIGYSNGIVEQQSSLTTVLNSVKMKAQQYLNTSNSSYSWGRDMIQGFVNGINSLKTKFSNTVQNIANTVSRFLHFSRPDEGPLHDYETWMPDMVQGLSDSLLSSAPVLDNAVTDVAGRIANNLSSTNLDMNVSGNIDKNINSNIIGSQLENAVYSAIQKAESLFKLTINNELKINSKTIAREILDDIDGEIRRRGYKTIFQRG